MRLRSHDSVPATKFSQFKELPLELRQIIWRLVLPQRRVVIWRDRRIRASATDKHLNASATDKHLKALRGTCTESRAICFEYYTHIHKLLVYVDIDENTIFPPIYVDFNEDTIFLPFSPNLHITDALEPFKPHFHQIQRLAIDYKWFEMCTPDIIRLVLRMPALEQLKLIVSDRDSARGGLYFSEICLEDLSPDFVAERTWACTAEAMLKKRFLLHWIKETRYSHALYERCRRDGIPAEPIAETVEFAEQRVDGRGNWSFPSYGKFAITLAKA
jgi:hypothetical protein